MKCWKIAIETMSEINDLELALVLAAADADSRNHEEPNLFENSEEEVPFKEAEFYKNVGEGYPENYNIVAAPAHSAEKNRPQMRKRVEETSELRTNKGYGNVGANHYNQLEENHNIFTAPAQSSEKNRPQKRRREEETSEKTSRGYANVVANHYNQLEEKGLDERLKSRIVHLRNFHNWIKSMLINEYLTKIKDNKKHNAPLRVHDMCCGKGGDLLKWKKGYISHLICSDIAAVSLDQCKARYTDMKNRPSRDRGPPIYSIEYIAGDCSRMRLREKYSDPSVKVDLVSCQFAFHYSFESLPQAECMLRNAAECLQPGGYFIGTIPDAYDLVARAKKLSSSTYGNNVYKVSMDFDIDKPPLFGAKYNFQLDGVVNCPEFLVYFPMLVKLAKKFGLKLVKSEKFYDFFERMKGEGRHLLNRMRSLEAYPPTESSTLNGTDSDDYTHASDFLKSGGHTRIETLSKSEWEASSLYTMFVFQKAKNTWNADGTPLYDI